MIKSTKALISLLAGSLLALVLGVAVSPLVVTPLSAAESPAKTRSVSPTGLEKLLAERKDLVVLDVRTAEERSGGHLPHSTNVDARASDFRDQLSRLDHSKTYVVHCVRGLKRTTDTVAALDQLGFTNVLSLEGGYNAWVKEGKTVEK